jgi:hypothetical protein
MAFGYSATGNSSQTAIELPAALLLGPATLRKCHSYVMPVDTLHRPQLYRVNFRGFMQIFLGFTARFPLVMEPATPVPKTVTRETQHLTGSAFFGL